MGVINAVRQAACTQMMTPTGLVPMLLQAWIAMGMKISMTARFCMTCVSRNGMEKNIK